MSTPEAPAVSLVITTLNEADSIGLLLASVMAQTRPPDEVVIVDGGSTDGTTEVIGRFAERLRLRLLEEPGCNIAQGRNRAIAAARGDIIAVTDGGVRLTPQWLEELLAALERSDPGPYPVAAGFFVADPRTTFERALGATTLPRMEEIDPARFLPSSRSIAFTTEAWQAVGGYPEWLDYCEDLIFDFKLRQRYGGFAWAPKAMVFFRPRSTLRAFFLQYFRYARGDGKADLWRHRHLIRYSAYGLGILLVFAGFSLPWLWLLLLSAFGGYLWRPYRRVGIVASDLPLREKSRVYAWVPLIRLTGDAAKMVGYPVGLWWRWRHRPTGKARSRQDRMPGGMGEC